MNSSISLSMTNVSEVLSFLNQKEIENINRIETDQIQVRSYDWFEFIFLMIRKETHK